MNERWPRWIRTILDSQDEVAYLLDADSRIAACNRGWDKFAALNGGEGASSEKVTGRGIFEFIPDVLVEFYSKKHAEVRLGKRWVGFDYECSSPVSFRLFHMAMHSYDGSTVLIINAQLPGRLAPWSDGKYTVEDRVYVAGDGVVTMCAHCRRTRRWESLETWDWVPRFLRRLPTKVSHGLCPSCAAYLYPDRFGPVSQEAGEGS